jgi:hypothetical protein
LQNPRLQGVGQLVANEHFARSGKSWEMKEQIMKPSRKRDKPEQPGRNDQPKRKGQARLAGLTRAEWDRQNQIDSERHKGNEKG